MIEQIFRNFSKYNEPPEISISGLCYDWKYILGVVPLILKFLQAQFIFKNFHLHLTLTNEKCERGFGRTDRRGQKRHKKLSGLMFELEIYRLVIIIVIINNLEFDFELV